VNKIIHNVVVNIAFDSAFHGTPKKQRMVLAGVAVSKRIRDKVIDEVLLMLLSA